MTYPIFMACILAAMIVGHWVGFRMGRDTKMGYLFASSAVVVGFALSQAIFMAFQLILGATHAG